MQSKKFYALLDQEQAYYHLIAWTKIDYVKQMDLQINRDIAFWSGKKVIQLLRNFPH